MTDPPSGPKVAFPGVKLAAAPTVMTVPSGSSMFTSRVGVQEPSGFLTKASHGKLFDSGFGPSGDGAVSAKACDVTSNPTVANQSRLLILLPFWAAGGGLVMCDFNTGFAGGLQSYAASMCGTRPGIADQEVRTAVISTSTLNSGLVKPDTITSVEANALPDT